MRKIALSLLYVLLVLSLIAGCNNNTPTPPSTPDVFAAATEAAPTLPIPTEAAPTETTNHFPAEPKESVTDFYGIEVTGFTAWKFAAIRRYNPSAVMSSDDSSLFMAFSNELRPERLDLFAYENNEARHIPLVTPDGENYHVIGNQSNLNGPNLVFDCVSFDENGDYLHINVCTINVHSYEFAAMPLPENYDYPMAYDFGSEGITNVLVAVEEYYTHENDQIFRWNLESNTVTQLSFAPVDHERIEVSSSELFAATESYTGDWFADQYIQTYYLLGEDWKFRGAAIQGFMLGWANDKLMYMTHDPNCFPEACSKIRTYDPATQSDAFLLAMPTKVHMYSDMLVSPDERYMVFMADSGTNGIYSCYTSIGSICSQIVPPLNGGSYENFGFLGQDHILMKINGEFHLFPAAPEKG